jgi:hypothetical protein
VYFHEFPPELVKRSGKLELYHGAAGGLKKHICVDPRLSAANQ